MGDRRRPLTPEPPKRAGTFAGLAALGALARCAALIATVVAFGTLPGAVLRPIVVERTVPPVPDAADHDASLRVHVVSEVDRRALPHAHVRVLSVLDDRAYLSAIGETDGAGLVALGSLPRAATWIVADADGYARASTQRVLTGAGTSLELGLPRAHHLSVVVADDLGQPVLGAEIDVSGGDPLPVGARTGPDGHADTSRLAAGPWTLAVHANGFEDIVRRGVQEGETPRLVLRRLGALLVRVVDSSGEPASLAHVQVAGSSLWPARSTDTSTEGAVRIGGLRAGSYALRATSGGRVSQTEVGLPLARGEERNVVLTLATGVYASAVVVDGDADPSPVERARVTLVEGGLSPFPLEGTTDLKGTVRLGPVALGPAFLSAEADGFVPSGAVDAPPDGHTVTLTLARAGVVEGRVVDGHGRPVDGATLEVVGSSASGSPIDDDPRKQSFHRAEFEATVGGAHALIPSGELGVVPGPVPPIPRPLDVTAGLSAMASSNRRGGPVAVEPWVTKDDGTFRCSPASPGRIRVVVRHPAYLETLSDAVTLAPGGSAQVDIVLRAGGTLEGRVVDSQGRAVADAIVALAALRGSLERGTRTASDGTFAFAAVPEAVVVTASRGDEADGSFRVARSLVQVADEGNASVTLTLPEARRSLPVRVRDDRGYPVAAAQVSVGSVDPKAPLRTTVFTDERGEASVAGARGIALRLEVSAPGHARRFVKVAAEDVSAEVALEAAATLSGSVRTPRGGAPVKGAEVTLFSDDGVRRTATSEAGTFALPDVAAGAARLRIRAEGRVTKTLELTVVANGPRRQELHPIDLDEEATVEGTVVDGHGDPVPGARVGKDHAPTYLPATGRDPSFAVTDGRGHFRLGGLEEGSLTLEAYAPDVGRGRASSVRTSTGRTTRDVTIALGSAGDGEGPLAKEPASSGGVAVTLGELEGAPPAVVVVAVASGSEAERAGLAPGDILVDVDGARVETMADARARLSGPVGDDVVVTRRRGDVSEPVRVPREPVRR